MTATSPQPDPARIFETLTAHQQTMALKGAIELEIFTHIADGASTAAEIANRCSASERGVRVLCDYLTIQEFLSKSDGKYSLTADSAVFLNKRSPAYMGSMAGFLTHEGVFASMSDIAGTVRKGGTLNADSAAQPENPLWVEFARSMMPMAGMEGAIVAAMTADRPVTKILDIAASHGLYGIQAGLKHPEAQIVGLDWKNVLEVAKENAARMGLGARYSTIEGSAFEVDLGSGYDLVLLPNFLHHFDPATNVKLLKRIHSAMKPGGTVATIEFVPNEDRVTPKVAAAFSLTMLASTDHGDAYTFAEFDRMFKEAGFAENTMVDLVPSPQRLIRSRA